MSTPFDLYQTVWWRFSRYEIRDGYIRPAPGTELVSYDPWEDYRDSWIYDPDAATPWPEKRKNKPPYVSLLSVVKEIRFSPSGLTPASETLLLDWCSEYGLLGMLSQRVQKVTLMPRWESASWKGISTDPRPFEDGMLHQTTYEYNRLNSYARFRGWYPHQWFNEEGEPGRQEGEPILIPELPYLHPRALVQDIALLINEADDSWQVRISGNYYEERLNETWGSYFPDVPQEEKESFLYPIPNSDHFWHIYAESIVEFVAGALLLAEALDEVNAEQPPRHFKLNYLLSPVSTVIERTPDGTLQQRWTAPSLLSCFATMASQDLTQNRKVLACETCNRMFVTGAYQARYCSDKCRRTAQKRRYREKLKEESNDGEKKNRRRNTTKG